MLFWVQIIDGIMFFFFVGNFFYSCDKFLVLDVNVCGGNVRLLDEF